MKCYHIYIKVYIYCKTRDHALSKILYIYKGPSCTYNINKYKQIYKCKKSAYFFICKIKH